MYNETRILKFIDKVAVDFSKYKDEAIGAGAGAVTAGTAAALMSKKNKLRNALIAALGGAVAGGTVGHVKAKFDEKSKALATAEEKAKSEGKARAFAEKAKADAEASRVEAEKAKVAAENKAASAKTKSGSVEARLNALRDKALKSGKIEDKQAYENEYKTAMGEKVNPSWWDLYNKHVTNPVGKTFDNVVEETAKKAKGWFKTEPSSEEL